jgi:hypothetical protein
MNGSSEEQAVDIEYNEIEYERLPSPYMYSLDFFCEIIVPIANGEVEGVTLPWEYISFVYWYAYIMEYFETRRLYNSWYQRAINRLVYEKTKAGEELFVHDLANIQRDLPWYHPREPCHDEWDIHFPHGMTILYSNEGIRKLWMEHLTFWYIHICENDMYYVETTESMGLGLYSKVRTTTEAFVTMVSENDEPFGFLMEIEDSFTLYLQSKGFQLPNSLFVVNEGTVDEVTYILYGAMAFINDNPNSKWQFSNLSEDGHRFRYYKDRYQLELYDNFNNPSSSGFRYTEYVLDGDVCSEESEESDGSDFVSSQEHHLLVLTNPDVCIYGVKLVVKRSALQVYVERDSEIFVSYRN